MHSHRQVLPLDVRHAIPLGIGLAPYWLCTPAVFKVFMSSAISTTVPTGATTGPVQVVIPSGTLT